MITSKGMMFYSDAPQDDESWKRAGWRWLNGKKCWMTSNIQLVIPLLPWCDDATKNIVDTWQSGRAAAIAASVAATVDVHIPSPEGWNYRDYQKAGAVYMKDRYASLNADVPRLGKTIQSMGVINSYDRPLKVFVVGPAVSKTNWCKEADRWLVHKTTVGYCEGDENPKTDFLVCNYDILTRHIEWIREQPWDIVIADEAHYLKNKRTAQRTQAFFTIPPPKLHRLFLTGSPIYTRPIDIWPVVEVCDPHGLGRNWFSFVRRYCDAKKKGAVGWDTSGASHQEELQFKMRKSFMVRREKSDVLAEIPTARHTIYLPKTGLDRLIKRERNAVQKNLDALIKALELENTSEIEELAKFDGREDTDDLEMGSVAQVRRDLAVAKIGMVASFIEDMLLTEEKVVVFGHHRDVVKGLSLKFPGSACVMGGLSTKQRDEQIEMFRNDPSCRIIVGNMTSMGTAISLAVADVAVFAELSWIPSEIDQCEERIWDPTKTNPCSIYRLVLEDSLEAQIAAVLEARQASIDRIMSAKHLSKSQINQLALSS
jgi:SWI/SNF-related matrix-associated actin-dependent regulator 1 of chromatin subfamily A